MPEASDSYRDAVTGTPRETYSHGHAESVLRSHRRRTAENSAGYLLPLLRPTDRLLDVGSGPWTITADLAARLSAGAVTGLDVAATAVAGTRRLAAERGLRNLTVTKGNVYALAYDDATFNVVHAHQVLQHLADPVSALREMARVCAPDGIVAARDADYAAMTWYPDRPELRRWMQLYQSVARHNGGEPDAGRRLVGWARAAGFASVTATASAWCFADREDRHWWSETWADRLLTSSFGEQAVQLGFTDVEELTNLARGWRAWAAAPDAWFAVLHGEVICRPAAGPILPTDDRGNSP
jgi:ubiquinone/menaquinone biosynthesis C-methylase UbiE